MKIRKIDVTDIEGFYLGNAEDPEAGTGCTVIICEEGAVAGVDVKGGGPATRETDLLRSENTVETINAVVLSGGSAFGLEAASGVMRYLKDRKVGFSVGDITVPIVTGASLFDLAVGDSNVFPDVKMGIRACENAYNGVFANGNHGAGTGATCGKILGMERAMKTGLGTFACGDDFIQVGAISAVNACADVYNGAGNIIAGLRNSDGSQIQGCIRVLKGMIHPESEQEISLDDIKAIAKDEKNKSDGSKEETPEDIAAAMQAAFEANAVSAKASETTVEPLPAEVSNEQKSEIHEETTAVELPAETAAEETATELLDEIAEEADDTVATVVSVQPEIPSEVFCLTEVEPAVLTAEDLSSMTEPEIIEEVQIQATESAVEEEQPAEAEEPAAAELAAETVEETIEETAEEISEEVIEDNTAASETEEEDLDESDMGYDIPFNTTISCLITNAKLTKPQANKLASILHDAYARAIKPVHSTLDGDTIFVMATGKQDVNFDAFAALATDVMQYAIIDGAHSAEGAYGLPASRDIIHK